MIEEEKRSTGFAESLFDWAKLATLVFMIIWLCGLGRAIQQRTEPIRVEVTVDDRTQKN